MTAQGDLNWYIPQACEGGACIGVARSGDSVLIGNAGQPEGPVGVFTTDEWRAFLVGVKSGDFDAIA